MKAFLSNPLYLGIAGVLIAVAIFLAFRHFERKEIRGEGVLVNTGILKEREAATGEVFNRVEKADTNRNPATAAERQRVCSKYDRNCSPNGQ